MNSKRVMLWLVIALVLISLFHAVLHWRGLCDKRILPRTSLLAIAPGELTRIAVTRHDGEDFELVKRARWRIARPFTSSADIQKVQELIDSLAFSEVVASYSENEIGKFNRTMKDFGLDENAIEINASSPTSEAIIRLGKLSPSKDSVYAAVNDENKIYIADKKIREMAMLPLKEYRQYRVFPNGIGDVSVVDIKHGLGKVVRLSLQNNGAWQCTRLDKECSPASIDLSKMKSFLTGMEECMAKSFVWPVGAKGEALSPTASLLASYGLESDSALTVTLKTIDGKERQISVGKAESGNSSYALIHNMGAIVTIDSAIAALIANADVTTSRLFPVEKEKINGVELIDGDNVFSVAKTAGGDDWRLEAPISASANAKIVEQLLSRIVLLEEKDLDRKGISVSLSSEARCEVVSRRALLGDLTLADLRGRQIFSCDINQIKRIAATSRSNGKTVAISWNPVRDCWENERGSIPAGRIKDDVARGIIQAVSKLEAEVIVKLKTTLAELQEYGLENPEYTISIDQKSEGTVRRNILIGNQTPGGYYATVGSADAIFIISGRSFADLTQLLQEDAIEESQENITEEQ